MLLLAAASSVETYGGQGGSVAAESSAGLPMTGLDIVFLLIAALILVGVGMAMARFAKT